jgi:hypothetical protein
LDSNHGTVPDLVELGHCTVEENAQEILNLPPFAMAFWLVQDFDSGSTICE